MRVGGGGGTFTGLACIPDTRKVQLRSDSAREKKNDSNSVDASLRARRALALSAAGRDASRDASARAPRLTLARRRRAAARDESMVLIRPTHQTLTLTFFARSESLRVSRVSQSLRVSSAGCDASRDASELGASAKCAPRAARCHFLTSSLTFLLRVRCSSRAAHKKELRATDVLRALSL